MLSLPFVITTEGVTGRACPRSAPGMSTSYSPADLEDQTPIPTLSPNVQLLHQRHAKDNRDIDLPHLRPIHQSTTVRQKLLYAGQVILFGVIVVQFAMLYRKYAFAAACSLVDAGALRKQQLESSSTDLPQYYQTKPELWPGMQ